MKLKEKTRDSTLNIGFQQVGERGSADFNYSL